MSNVEGNLAWAFPGLKLGGWWEAGSNSPHISKSMSYFHHPRRHHLTCRQRGPRWRDATTSWHTFLVNGLPMVSHKAVNDHDHTKDIPKPLEMKLPCEYQESSLLDHQDGWCIANKQRRTTLCHAARRQRQLRRSLSLHPQDPDSSTKNQRKSRKVDRRRACSYPYFHRMVKRQSLM
jgi:hypothetical protein